MFCKKKKDDLVGTLSEEIAQSTVYHPLRQICVYLHFTIMHKVIGVTLSWITPGLLARPETMSHGITKCLLKCLLFGIATFWRGRECCMESIRVNESIA